jgi:hypothetical protein
VATARMARTVRTERRALSTITWVLAGGVAWILSNVAILAFLKVASSEPELGPDDVRSTGELVGRLAEDVLGVLGVERVAVVMHDSATPGRGVVEACCGRPEVVGSTVPVTGGFGWGAGLESAFLIADRPDRAEWAVVSVPVSVDTGLTGIVVVATRRRRGLTGSDVELLERLATRAALHADRQDEAARFDRRTFRDTVA